MDQVKNILAVIKKYHFWILCGLAVLVGLGMTISAKSKLLKSYDEEKGKISGVQGQVQPIASSDNPPNQKWVDDDKTKTDAGRLEILHAWEKRYDEQAKAVYQWPADLFPDDPAFLKEFAAADDQTEKKLDRKTLMELGDRYIYYIPKVTLPRLAAIIDAEWTVTDEKDAARAAAAPVDTASHKVVWDPADQQTKVENYTWEQRPSRLDMQYAQEEMWVMEALFRAIQRANGDAKGSYDAAVRRLTEVLVGYNATGRSPLGEGSGRIVRTMPTAIPVTGSAPTGSGDAGTTARQTFEAVRPNRRDQTAGAGTSYGPRTLVPRGADASAPTGARGADASAPGGGEGAGGDTYAWLKDGRYVDAKCQPLLGSELQNSKTPEYKLMAFRLVLEVDEAQYPRIIEELANSVLPIEVREVRINGDAAQSMSPSRAVSPGRGGSRPVGGRNVRSGQFPRSDASAPTTGPSRPFVPSSKPVTAPEEAGNLRHNVPMEIYGVVYLIDRPDRKKLGLPETDAGATAATPPATAPATGATAPADAATAPAAATGTATTTTTTAPATAPAPATTEPPGTTGATAAAPTETNKGSTNGATPATPATGPPDVAPAK